MLRTKLLFVSICSLSSLVGFTAFAQKPTDEPKKTGEPQKAEEPKNLAGEQRKPQSLSHKYQVGLGLRAGTGFRATAPFHEENCGDVDSSGKPKSFCSNRQPFWLEFSPSFGLTTSLEALVDVRLYLEGQDLSKSKGFFIAPGIKYYTDAEDLFKFFLSGQIVLEQQEQAQATLSNFDIGLRSALGVQFDLMRYIGLFAQGGILVGFKRWLTFAADFSGGVQVRY